MSLSHAEQLNQGLELAADKTAGPHGWSCLWCAWAMSRLLLIHSCLSMQIHAACVCSFVFLPLLM